LPKPTEAVEGCAIAGRANEEEAEEEAEAEEAAGLKKQKKQKQNKRQKKQKKQLGSKCREAIQGQQCTYLEMRKVHPKGVWR
jgi:hypothetical protein